MKREHRIEYRSLDELIPYANNSRTHSDEQVAQIAASIREFGFTNPILIDEENGIIAGHGRLMAARRIGMDKVPCIVIAGLTEAQKKALVIADNKLALNADWDEDMLAAEIERLQELSFDIDLLGFSEEELDELLALEPDDTGDEGLTDPDEAPEPPPVPVSRPGDVWVLGQHRVLCGDSTDIDAVLGFMGEDRVDCLITDPPYNVAYEGKTKDALTIANDAMDDAAFRQFLTDAFITANAVMKPGASFYIWHADSEGFNFRGACRDVGWKVRQCLIWVKNTFVLGRQDYHWRHEPCLYGWTDGGAHKWYGDRAQSTVLEFDRPNRNAEHPTMKPVELIEYQIRNSTKSGDTVLDLFGGSGTTLIACEKAGRTARLVELDPKYVDVIVRRWQDFTGQQSVHQATGRTFSEMQVEREKAA